MFFVWVLVALLVCPALIMFIVGTIATRGWKDWGRSDSYEISSYWHGGLSGDSIGGTGGYFDKKR